jgi:adenylate kinase family enzyme
MKITIFGIPGSGKSYFARQLSDATHVSVFHIDRYFFHAGPGWIERSQEDFLEDVEKELKKSDWIIEGNGMRSLEMRYKEADLVIYCTQPVWICYFRILKRAILGFFRSHSEADRPEGASNHLTWKLLKRVWEFRSKYGAKIESLRERYPEIGFIELCSDHDMEMILNHIRHMQKVQAPSAF